MLEICEKSHIATVINSLDKIYRQSKVNGELNPLDIYYIDIIYKLLYQCNIDISHEEKKQLVNIYNNLSFKSDYICPNTNIEPFHLNIKNTFVQNDINDCNELPSEEGVIYYWQEDSLIIDKTNISELISEEFLENKLHDTYLNFQNGKNINYINIGRICFLDSNSDSINYEIKDVLGNIITNQFDILNLTELKQTLIVSKNIYSFGEVFIKIKKITNV